MVFRVAFDPIVASDNDSSRRRDRDPATSLHPSARDTVYRSEGRARTAPAKEASMTHENDVHPRSGQQQVPRDAAVRAAACCEPAQQSACCAPDAKASCCGETPGERCGC